jgi:hypothetical protein
MGGTRVKLRAVVGGVFCVLLAERLWDAWRIGLTMWVLAGCVLLLFFSAGGLALMFHNTRDDRKQRTLGRWLLETLKVIGTAAIVLLAVFVLVHGYAVLAR